jgi:ABC-type branched-subunit amino acid transport system substrate-binding protein
MNKQLYIGLAVLAVVIGCVVLALHYNPQRKNGAIRLGVIFPMSGDYTAYGGEARNGVELAAADFEAVHPGSKVEVYYEDDQGQDKNVLGSYQKLSSIHGVDGMVAGLLITELQTIAGLANAEGMPVISPAALPKEERGKHANPLAMWPDPTLESEQMAQYAYDHGARNVAVLTTHDVWEQEISVGFANKFKAIGGSIVDQEVTLQNSKDVKVAVTKALATHPDAIFLGTYYKFFDYVKNARELGFKGTFYSLEVDANLAQQTKGLSDGTRFLSPNYFASDFVNRYTQKFGHVPVIPAGQAYDSAMLALKILSENPSKNDALKALGSVSEYDGVSGHITFSADHRATFPLNMFEIQSGEIKKIN